jgi:hypothetical protein
VAVQATVTVETTAITAETTAITAENAKQLMGK